MIESISSSTTRTLARRKMLLLRSDQPVEVQKTCRHPKDESDDKKPGSEPEPLINRTAASRPDQHGNDHLEAEVAIAANGPPRTAITLFRRQK